MAKTVNPTYYAEAYNCARCGVLCEHLWFVAQKHSRQSLSAALTKVDTQMFNKRQHVINTLNLGEEEETEAISWDWSLDISICCHCHKYTIWENRKIIFPFETELPEPNDDMPESVKRIYEEATQVYKHSPRAAAALLRLAIETMIPLLEEYQIRKAKLNTMIGELVKKDIPVHIQQGLDAIRVYGNEGIHPGEIDLNDDQDTVLFLFELINIMVEELITRKKKISSFYGKLPFDKIKGIMGRDKVTNKE